MSDELGRLLKFDPLGAAETITGESYKTDEGTMALGMLAALNHGERKRAALIANDDTHFSVAFSHALDIFKSLGFSEVYRQPIDKSGREGDVYIVAWSVEGILLTAESYHGVLNSGKILYNWQARGDVDNRWQYMSSGHWASDDVLIGDHPIIEGLRYNIERMRANGAFISPWRERPFLWLNPDEAEDYKAATAQIVAQLPTDVRNSIGGNR